MNRLLACCGIVIVSLCWGSFVNAAEFWQSGWSTPQKAESSSLLVRPIEAADAERLFHSYMGSQRYLYSQLGWSWPSEKSSLEQNQSMVKLHLKQWQQQTAFTYLVIDRERGMVVGAVYFVPVPEQRGQSGTIQGSKFNAEITWWLTEPAVNASLHNDLFQLLVDWLRSSWPWQQVLFPVADNNRVTISLLESSSARFVGQNRDTQERFYSYTLARK
ncbi:MAG: GNAT family N-acetyltransferase [Idiomarina sp.]|nr:GNAT family N-acetyltransferase [Idiomarina sp.]PHQ77489.1 MAG: GNAT family N-acetyltransferase [Idiomarina sp.]